MSTLEEFESALKDVVKAKRISQSKMNSLTEVALKCMDNDTQMVSILYRQHKGLPPSAKVSSLYAFDALARAARHRVNKTNMTGDLNSGSGNCATFLLRIEGILDGLFQDLMSSHSDELKEKAKKILDIWTKQNTFPSAVLSSLYTLLQTADKDKEPGNVVTTNGNGAHVGLSAHTNPPPAQPATSQPPAVQPVSVDAVQSTLMALLSQAANATSVPSSAVGQTAPNTAPLPQATPSTVPYLDANQLALIQQLTQAANGNAVPSQPVPVSASVVPPLTTPNAVPVVPPVQGPPQPQPFPYRDDLYGAAAPHKESEHGPLNGSERGVPRDNYNRDDPRREFRGGPRDYGRGGRGRGRRNDREHFRDRSKEFSRDPRGRRSRSPSGRYGGPGPGRDARPHSPPRRGGYGPAQYGNRALPPSYGYGPGADGSPSRNAPQAGKDEFGRDLREGSPRDSDSASAQGHHPRSASPLPPPGTGSVNTSDRGSVASENANPPTRPALGAPPYLYLPGPSASASFSRSTSTAPPSSTQNRASSGLEAFDRAGFDPSQPASWEALGTAWTATHGTMPTQEQLMQFVLGGVPVPPPQALGQFASSVSQQPQQQQQQSQPQPQHAGQSPPQQYPNAQPRQQDEEWRAGPPGPNRQWNNRPEGPRGGWRGGPNGGPGGGGGRSNFEERGRGYGRGRGDMGRGGHGRGDFGRRGFGRGGGQGGREDHGYGNGRGAYSAGQRESREQETDAVVLGGGDEYPSWTQEQQAPWPQEQQAPQGLPPMYSQPQPPFQQQSLPPYQQQAPPPFQQSLQPTYQQHLREPPQQQPLNAPPQPSPEGGGGGPGGRMQKVGDKWVFVRGVA